MGRWHPDPTDAAVSPRDHMASETLLLKAVVEGSQEVLSPVAVNIGKEYKEGQRDHKEKGGMNQLSEHSSLFDFSRIIYPVPKRTQGSHMAVAYCTRVVNINAQSTINLTRK